MIKHPDMRGRQVALLLTLCMPGVLFYATLRAEKPWPLSGEPAPAPVKEKQDTARKRNCEQKQIGDLFRKKGKPPKPPKRFSIIALPSISYNPNNGLLLGVGGCMGWKFGKEPRTLISSSNFMIGVTSKEQFISYFKSNVYTGNNKFFLQGDWRYYIYNAPTYGLGTNSPDTVAVKNEFAWLGENTSNLEGVYQLKYNYLKLHETASYRIFDHFYLGLGYHLDYYYAIEDLSLQRDTLPYQLTPNYVYSTYHGFNPNEYMLSGVSLNIVYDSRDNMISAYRGIYANLNYRYNFTFMGSNQNSSALFLEFRAYQPLSKKKPRHLVAFWLMGNFVVSGYYPYMALPAIGDDQRNRSGRGYVQGRYRGESLVYGEVEYRFPISQCSQILGGVVFVNAVTTTNKDLHTGLFEYIRPAVGIGLRIMLSKFSRTNLSIDYGKGYESQGLYFTAQEAF
ncbi:MAG TPA: BamA/TamA family outer membrane protein [Bacteroidales bacterium]|nr:BamA/TamA family outer membrane protein [Bacteroidales bacterium]